MTFLHTCYDYSCDFTPFCDGNQRVRGIEPPCAAWEAAVLPLNYTRKEIFDFRFAIADCNRNKLSVQVAVYGRCSVRCPERMRVLEDCKICWGQRTATAQINAVNCDHCHEITSSEPL
jgi:hypothetical protein